jgi:hypothetical protein
MAVGIRGTDHATLSIRKFGVNYTQKRRQIGRYSSTAYQSAWSLYVLTCFCLIGYLQVHNSVVQRNSYCREFYLSCYSVADRHVFRFICNKLHYSVKSGSFFNLFSHAYLILRSVFHIFS